MVDNAILGRALMLNTAQRMELIVALQDSLDDSDVTPEMAAFIRRRSAEATANPHDSVSLDELEQRVRSRQSV